MPIYAYFLAGIIIVTVLVNHYQKLRIFSRWPGLLAGFGVVSVPFLLWDYFATRDGHWSFNEEYILGPKIAGLPLEEIAFFFLVPTVMAIVWLLVRKNVQNRYLDTTMFYRPVLVVLALSSYMTIYRPYTFLVTSVATIFWLLAARTGYMQSYRFFIFQFWLFLLFFLSNTLLTEPPVVSYADQAIMGLRIGTIPIEDFLYNYVLINGFIMTFSATEKLK